MNTKDVGDVTVAMVLASLVKAGRAVLIPFGDNRRYDLVIEEDQCFKRIQCKTGHMMSNGSIRFSTCSSTFHRSGGRKMSYRGQADLFGVYCKETNKVYLVPVELVEPTGLTFALLLRNVLVRSKSTVRATMR